jgi:hypothetical protein
MVIMIRIRLMSSSSGSAIVNIFSPDGSGAIQYLILIPSRFIPVTGLRVLRGVPTRVHGVGDVLPVQGLEPRPYPPAKACFVGD